MPLVKVREESLDQGHFYVPQFEVKIAGVGLPRDVLRDVTQLTYKDNIKEIDGFELTINNWNPETRDFKYVGSKTGEKEHLFDPCNKEVEIWMGYAGHLQLMLKGTFTTLEPNFPASGAPTLAARGLNVLHQLRRKQYTYSWEKTKDSKIAKSITQLNDPDTKKKRFPLPIIAENEKNESEIPYVAQKNQYDIDFLLSRARERGYVVLVQEGDPKGQGDKRQRYLYFGPSDEKILGLRDVTFKLEWGVSLIDFKPTLTTANQIKSVTVNGWDRKTKKAISETVNLDDKKLNLNSDLRDLLKSCDPREEHVVDEPVFTTAQARERAIAILKDKQKEVIKASATCIGLPDLRAGKRVQIDGLGARFSGTYFVTETTHTIGDSGYTTKFNCRREDEGTSKNK